MVSQEARDRAKIQGRHREYARAKRPAIAARLRAEREAKGLSRRELSSLSGLKESAIRAIEDGVRRHLETEEYAALAMPLGRTPRWLVGMGA